MKDLDATMFDIEELSRKIDEKIKELEQSEISMDEEISKYHDEDLSCNMSDIDKLINDIDRRILELEKEEMEEQELDIERITNNINKKIDELDFEDKEEEDLEKTLYDLSEISKMINETIKKLERQKTKKKKKAMYCDLARKNAKRACNCSKKKTVSKK